MARREITQPVDFLRDVVWEEDTKPRPVVAAAANKVIPPTPPTEPVAGDTAQLRRLLEFAQWERVAMVRFGVASAAWATESVEPVSIFARKGAEGDPAELRRSWERLKAMIRDNHEATLKTLDEIGARLAFSDGDWL